MWVGDCWLDCIRFCKGKKSAILGNLPRSLKVLDMCEMNLDRDSLRSVLSQDLSNLHVLDVGDCRVEDGDALINLVMSCRSLSQLFIDGNSLQVHHYEKLLAFMNNRYWDKFSFGNNSDVLDLDFFEALLALPEISIFSLLLHGYFKSAKERLESIIRNQLSSASSIVRFKVADCAEACREALLQAENGCLLDVGIESDDDPEFDLKFREKQRLIAIQLKMLLSFVVVRHTSQSALKDWTNLPRQIWKYAAGWIRLAMPLYDDIDPNNVNNGF
eukprot:TRINITY_DN357_c0_g2_i1.p1 TRINITY_DN357_c0_g2~~TRINITY_DN357_c0_g2_i1.p1  ORF type:complete len:273 (-),score=66.08 TRINITY_DN357_c0_g2_i1:246-1064(-)